MFICTFFLYMGGVERVNICGTHFQKISGTSGKNHFHEMNGDVGMAGWK